VCISEPTKITLHQGGFDKFVAMFVNVVLPDAAGGSSNSLARFELFSGVHVFVD